MVDADRSEHDLDALDRTISEAVGRSGSEPATSASSPSIATIVQLLTDLHRVTPDPAFIAHLDQEFLMHALTTSAVANHQSTSRLVQAGQPPRMDRPALRSFAFPRPHRFGPILPLAALLVVIVGGLAASALTGRFGLHDQRDNPAITAPGYAATDDTLLTFTIPAEAVSTGDKATIGLVIFTIPARSRSTWQPYCCPGSLMEYVVSGTYTVRADAPIQVLRGDGSIEDILAGTEVVLEPGDGLLSRNETVVESANTGSVPVELLSWVLIEDDGTFRGHQLVGWLDGEGDIKSASALSVTATTVELRRVSVRDGDVLEPPQNELQLITEQEVDAYLSQSTTDGSLTVVGESPDTDYSIYVLTLTQPGMGQSTPTSGTPMP